MSFAPEYAIATSYDVLSNVCQFVNTQASQSIRSRIRDLPKQDTTSAGSLHPLEGALMSTRFSDEPRKKGKLPHKTPRMTELWQRVTEDMRETMK